MITRWIDEPLDYDGSQLRAHWILQTFGIVGDALVAFRGPCSVSGEEMADLEDLGGPGIAGSDMLHFLWERFDDAPLREAILRQRLLTCVAADVLRERGAPVPVRRDGDDLFLGEGKLSISIATRSSVSTLLHFAVNISNEGTPVRTACLAESGVEPVEFAGAILDRIAREEESMRLARAKVRAKGEAHRP
ncbi:MAG: DUF366 family protein [Planctomycetes bacterium]|nr:DUF366 family protein [Planctomycetota bacterium]